jgi:hypothetical protein
MASSELRIIQAEHGGWTVALGDVSLAGFYGPKARHMAESHRDLLVAALTADARDHGMEQRLPITVAADVRRTRSLPSKLIRPTFATVPPRTQLTS